MLDFFNKLVGKSFKIDSQGRTIFFPWGELGSGFIVDSEDTRKRTLRFIYWMWIFLFLYFSFGILIFVFGDIPFIYFFFLVFIFGPLYCIWILFSIHQLTKNLRKSVERPDFWEFLRKRALATHIAYPIFYEILFLYMLVIQIQTFQSELGKNWNIAYYIFDGIFLGIEILGLSIFGYMIYTKIRKK